MYIPPATPLEVTQPVDEEVSEKDKFKNGGEWFARYARYIVANFYNPLRRQFLPNNDLTDTVRVADRTVENFAYYFGHQANKTFKYTEQVQSGRSVQAVYIPDQKIRSLVDFMKGNVITMLQPIKDTISATGLSEQVQNDRDKLWNQLRLQYAMSSLMSDIPGVAYKPLPDKQFESLEDIEEFIEQWQHEYERDAVAITKNIYYDQYLENSFEDDGMQTFIGNLASTLFEVKNGKICIENIPAYNAIFDFRSKDQYGKGAMVCGGVFFGTPSEIFAKFPSLTAPERAEIIQMSNDNTSQNSFVTYWNNTVNFPNLLWWNRQTGTVAYAPVYFIARKDLRYKKKLNRFGDTKIKEIEDEKYYMVDNVRTKGEDIAGDTWTWAVHKSTLIGNKYLVDYGYPEYQVREDNRFAMPELPIKQLCHGMLMGYARSVVDRLRQHADERGRLMMKVQELTANDLGKTYFIHGDKLGEFYSAKDILEDLKAMKITVVNDSSGEPGDESVRKKTIELIDMTLDPNIMNYLSLADAQARAMEEIVNIPAIALGQQDRTIGKGVQERTIMQSTMGQKTVYSALMEFWRMKLQYGFNLAKLVYTQEPETVKLLPISKTQTYLLKITKKFRAQDIGIWIKPNDPIEQEDLRIFEQVVLGYIQNINNPDAAEALHNSLKLIRAQTFTEGEDMLEKYIRRKKKEVQKATQQQFAMEQQTQAQSMQAQQQLVEMQKMADYIKSLEEINLKGAWKLEEVQAKMMAEVDKKISEAIIAQAKQAVDGSGLFAQQTPVPQGAPQQGMDMQGAAPMPEQQQQMEQEQEVETEQPSVENESME